MQPIFLLTGVNSARYRAILFALRSILARSFKLSRAVAIIIGVVLPTALMSVSSSSSNDGPTNVSFATGPSPRPQQSEAQYVHIPFFTELAGMTSTLTLNNNLSEPAEATVTVFNSRGDHFTAPHITLQPRTAERFNLKALTQDARGDFNSGSVQIYYHGPPMAITSQVTILSETQRLSFDSVETSAMSFSSSRLDSIIWLPDDETRATVALTNTTNDNLSVIISSSQKGIDETKVLVLKPHETHLHHVKDLVKRNTGTSSAALLSLEHSGAPGALIASGFAVNAKKGFSSNLPFVDRSTAATTRLAGAHVRFGQPDPMEGFPSGTTFLAPLVIANAGNEPTEARVYVDYTVGSDVTRVEIGQFSLAPRELRQIELSEEMARRGVTRPVDEAGVDVEYTGAAGAVIGRLASYDASGNFVFDVPVKDPLGEKFRVSGSYPWRLDDGYTTTVHLKNTIVKEVYALVQVRYQGGSYNLERIKMAPYQTIAVDIRQLRDSQAADIRGSVMPRDVTGGQILWYEETVGSLIGRAEVMSPSRDVASSFSCGGSCLCPPSYASSFFEPPNLAGPENQFGSLTVYEMRGDCVPENTYGPFDRTFEAIWSSSNPAVASVQSPGSIFCDSPGTCGITAQFEVRHFEEQEGCFETIFPVAPVAPVAVKPLITVRKSGQNMFSPNPISLSGQTTTIGAVNISASSACADPMCLQPGDVVMVEIIKNSPGGQFSYHAINQDIPGQTQQVPALSRLLDFRYPEARQSAAAAIRNTGGSAAIKPLMKALYDSDRNVRYQAVIGLAEITRQYSWAPSVEVYEGDERRYLTYWRNWARAR